MKKITFKTLLVAAAMLLGVNCAWGAAALTKSLSVTGYEAVALYDFQNKNFDGTALSKYEDLTGLGVTSQVTIQTDYGKNNWYDDSSNGRGLRLQAGGGRWIQFTVDIKKDDYIIINGGAASGTYGMTMTGGESAVVSEASDYLCFKATADAESLKLTVNRYNYLLQILIMTKDAGAATADYTINYKSGGSTVKSVAGTEAVGTVIPVLSTFTEGGVKYITDDGQASSLTVVAGGSTLDINVSEAPKYTYTVNDNLGNTLASGNAYKGDDVTFYVPYFAFSAGKFYKSPSLSSGTLSYGQGTLSGISENTSITVTYTEETSTNVVFYDEAENLTGVTAYEDGFTNIRMSNGKVGYYAAETAFTTLPAGVYTLTAATRSGTTVFYAGAVGEGVEIVTLSSSGAVTEVTSDPFTLTKSTDIYTSVGSSSTYFDYVIIRQVSNASVAVGSEKWATYVTPYAMDFTSVSGLKAYTATLSGSTVTLNEAGEVPAGTALVLKATAADTYSVPVIVSASAVTNDLKSGAVAAGDNDGATYYGLTVEGDKAKFALVTGAIPAGKAYLVKAGGARELTVVFGEEATGIETVKAQINNNRYYNLQGVEVAQPTKGLYIVNGKKLLVK